MPIAEIPPTWIPRETEGEVDGVALYLWNLIVDSVTEVIRRDVMVGPAVGLHQIGTTVAIVRYMRESGVCASLDSSPGSLVEVSKWTGGHLYRWPVKDLTLYVWVGGRTRLFAPPILCEAQST